MTGIFDSDDNSIISESSDESRGQGVESFLPSIDISCPSIQDFAGMITRAASSAVNKCLGGRKPQPRHDQVDRNTTDQGNYTRLLPGDVHQESTITASVQSPDESTDLSVQGLLADGNNAEHRNDGQEGGPKGTMVPAAGKTTYGTEEGLHGIIFRPSALCSFRRYVWISCWLLHRVNIICEFSVGLLVISKSVIDRLPSARIILD